MVLCRVCDTHLENPQRDALCDGCREELRTYSPSIFWTSVGTCETCGITNTEDSLSDLLLAYILYWYPFHHPVWGFLVRIYIFLSMARRGLNVFTVVYILCWILEMVLTVIYQQMRVMN